MEEHQLANPALKDNFIQRVCVMHRWQQLAKEDSTIYPLIRFHRQHHHLYLSHDPAKAAKIEVILSLKNTIAIDDLHAMYIQSVIDALRSIPSRKNHVGCLATVACCYWTLHHQRRTRGDTAEYRTLSVG